LIINFYYKNKIINILMPSPKDYESRLHRRRGHCYCGYPIKRIRSFIINKYFYFMVCSRTNFNIKKCLYTLYLIKRN